MGWELEIEAPFRSSLTGLFSFCSLNPQLKLRAIFVRRSATCWRIPQFCLCARQKYYQERTIPAAAASQRTRRAAFTPLQLTPARPREKFPTPSPLRTLKRAEARAPFEQMRRPSASERLPRHPKSARGLAHSKTLRAVRKSPVNASRFGLRQPSAAFPRAHNHCRFTLLPLRPPKILSRQKSPRPRRRPGATGARRSRRFSSRPPARVENFQRPRRFGR